MRKILTALFSIVAIGAFATVFTVGTNSTTLAVAKPVAAATAWSNGVAYAQGTIVASSNSYYMAKAAGTSSTNAPGHTVGEASDGTVTWIYTPAKKRRYLAISVKTSGGRADLSFDGTDAVATNDVRLVGEGHAIIFGPVDNYQGGATAISADGSDVVLGVTEF